MQSKWKKRIAAVFSLAATSWCLGVVGCLCGYADEEKGVTISVGRENADVTGDDNTAIQKAIDRVAAAGGGKVLIRAGTYSIHNSVRLASRVTLQGEGAEKTVLKKDRGVISRLKLDAEADELSASVEDSRRFQPGMGVILVDNVIREGVCPEVKTIQRIEGSRLFFDRYVEVNFYVRKSSQVSNAFPVMVGDGLEEFSVRDLTVDSARAEREPIGYWCSVGGIDIRRSRRFSIRNCAARNFAGDGIVVATTEHPTIENCEVYGNAEMGIHLGSGTYQSIVRGNRSHHNGRSGIYLCWRVQHGVFEKNESWANADGISIGHKDTDNTFVKNVVHHNAIAGFLLREDEAINAPHRNTLRENVIEDNGRPDAPGYGVRIDGPTHQITLESNIIRETRSAEQATQHIGIYLGAKADYITCERNIFGGSLKQAIVDKSGSKHNSLLPAQRLESETSR
jgi:parallel beta-helix repeat protein